MSLNSPYNYEPAVIAEQAYYEQNGQVQYKDYDRRFWRLYGNSAGDHQEYSTNTLLQNVTITEGVNYDENGNPIVAEE